MPTAAEQVRAQLTAMTPEALIGFLKENGFDARMSPFDVWTSRHMKKHNISRDEAIIRWKSHEADRVVRLQRDDPHSFLRVLRLLDIVPDEIANHAREERLETAQEESLEISRQSLEASRQSLDTATKSLTVADRTLIVAKWTLAVSIGALIVGLLSFLLSARQ